MSTFADNLASLRAAAAAGVVPPDLARWAADTIVALAPVAERVQARNAMLRQAAARLGGTRWARARRLEREILALGASHRPLGPADPGDDGVRALVAGALLVGPRARISLRHLLTILR